MESFSIGTAVKPFIEFTATLTNPLYPYTFSSMDTEAMMESDTPAQKMDRIHRLLKDNFRVVHDLAEFYKLFCDPTRIQILLALGAGELCVGDIATLLDMSQSAISHQLRLLSRTRLIKSRKLGKHVYYTLNDRHIKTLLSLGFEHIQES